MLILSFTIVIILLIGLMLIFLQMNRRLQSQTEFWHNLLDRTTAGILIVSSDRQIVEVNRRLCEMYGYRRDELVGQSAEILHLDRAQFERFGQWFASALANGPMAQIEYQYRRKDDSTFWAVISGGALVMPDGDAGVVWNMTDISDRKQTEDELAEERSHLKSLFEVNGSGMLVVSSARQILQVNGQFCNLFGYSRDELVGQSAGILHIDQQHYEDWAPCFQEARSGLPLASTDYPWRRKDGTVFWCFFAGVKMQLPNGESGVLWNVIDITVQHLAREAIIQEKEISQRYLDIAGAMLCALNRAGEIILMNKKASQILGYRDNELLGQNWFDVCLPESVRERVKGVFAQQLAGNLAPVEFYENTVINYNGEERMIAFHNTLLHDEEGVCGVLFSGEDITEQRKMHEELLKNQKLESLGVLAGGIAHDFNNILSGIMGNISFARMSLATPDKAEKLLENAEKASLRAAMLAAQLLTFAKGGEPIKKKMSVGTLLEESLLLALRGANVKGEVDFPETLRTVEADEGQLSQVFNNLIINAVQAMPGGGMLTIKAENFTLKDHEGSLLPQGEYVKLSFIDHGCGISKEDQRKIFDPYFTTKSGGNGLGLASVYSIVKRHGGHIGVSSAIGKGATFTVYLPSMCEAFTEHQAETVTQSSGDHAGGFILVMDDEAMIRDMTSEMLVYLGYQVTTCGDGAEAISLYEAAIKSGAPFSVVIMDLTIPGGMGGKEAADQILAIDPKARLFVSSGYSNDPIMSDYSAYGFSGAVAKPYNINDLGQQLSAALFVK